MLEWIISSSVLIAVVICLRFILKGKISLRLQYMLWALVLVRLLLPFSIGSSHISIMNQVEHLPAYQEIVVPEDHASGTGLLVDPAVPNNQTPPIVIPNNGPSEGNIGGNSGVNIGENTAEIERPEQNTPNTPETPPAQELPSTPITERFHLASLLRAVWLGGGVILGAWFVATNLLFAQKLRKNRTAMQTASPLPVYLCDKVDTPCLFGLFRPAIYLTSDVASDARTMRHAVEHEMTHYRHKDHIWAILRCVCLAVHWYNPLVWCAAILSRNDAELSCDDSTIRRLGESERAEYGRTLLRLTCEKRTAILTTATTMTGSGRSIKERIALIVKKPKMAIYTLVAVLLVAAIAVGCTFTGAKERPHSFAEWTESLTAEDIQLAEVAKEYGTERIAYTINEEEYDELCAILTAITANDCFLSKPEGNNEDGYRLVLYRADKLWLFKCLSDGTIGLMFNDAETGAYFGCEGSLLIIDCPDLWSFIVRTVDDKGTANDELPVQTGLYSSMEDYVNHRMEQMENVSYYSAATQDQVTVGILDAKIGWLEKRGEVFGLAPNGALEAWSYNILVKPDADPEDIMLVGGQYDEDGYFDLEGQGGRITVALRDANGMYDVLYDAVINDGLDFFGYCNTTDEAIHDWYVKQYGLDIPLYATDWIDCITVPEGGSLGNFPVHRFDGDGWYIYIPVQTWKGPANAETPCVFTSAYYTGSTLKVDYFDYAPEGLSDDHRKQGFTLIDEENLIWSRNSDGVSTQYYCFDAPDGGCWRVTIEWVDANITEYPYIAMEPDLLRLMAESFTVCGSKTVTTLPVLTLSDMENDAVCAAAMHDLKTGWWNGLPLADCTYEAGAFECVYREDNSFTKRFYGYAGYFRFDENGNCVEYWYAPSIVTLDALSTQIHNIWWPGDGAYYERDILDKFPDEIAEFVAEPNEERYQVIRDRLLEIARARMLPVTPTDTETRLSSLVPEDVKQVIARTEPSAAEIVDTLRTALSNRIEHDEIGIDDCFWTFEFFLSGGDPVYSYQSDEWVWLKAGLEENIVEIWHWKSHSDPVKLFVEDQVLYQMVRGTYYTEPFIDEDAFARYGDILEDRAQKTVDQSRVNLADTPMLPYTGYEITELVKVDEFTQKGDRYEVYEWDVAFLHDDPTKVVWAGGMWLDSQLRVRSVEETPYFVVCISGDTVAHDFFFWDLYSGSDEESGKFHALTTITKAFGSSLDMQTTCANLTHEWQRRSDLYEEPLSFLRVDENRERELTVEGNMLSVLSSAANNLQQIGRPDNFRALGGGIYVWFDSTRHLAFFAGEEPYTVLIRYVADDANDTAVVNDPQLYLYIVASAEQENVQLVDLDDDGFLEAVLWLHSESNFIIYDYYGSEIHRIDTNHAIGCSSSSYTGLIANIQPAFNNMVQAQSEDGTVSIYRYKDGAFTYECPISEVLR